MDVGSLMELLNFLMYSFGGGTDVDRPLELSLDRLEQRDWSQVRGSPHDFVMHLYKHVGDAAPQRRQAKSWASFGSGRSCMLSRR